ncbi:MAG: GGDEF domain-containing protein [Candidatus Hydrogenedentota bacterium]
MSQNTGNELPQSASANAEEHKARLANRRLLEGMDIVTTAALALQTTEDGDAYMAHVVDVTLRAISDLVDFHVLGIAWFDSTGLEWKVGVCVPESRKQLLMDEINYQIEHDFVGWAITHNKPMSVPSLLRGKRTFIHSLGTQRRVAGFFLGISNEGYVPDVYQKLISILLVYCANTLESHRLYTENLERRAEEQRLQKLSLEDPLTGLANRRHFDDVLMTEVRRSARTRSIISLIMVDIDGFKAYNDEYGHQQGDEALQRVAAVVGGSVGRAGDLAARYGGEEFAVILPITNTEGVGALGERIRSSIERLRIPHLRSSTGTYLTASVGVCSAEGSSELSPPSLIGAADRALYRAKRLGGNCLETESV